MAIYPEGSFFTREQLASSKLNTMVNAINTHTHNGTSGVKLDLTTAVTGILSSSLGGTGQSNPANTIIATEKLVIPLGEPDILEDGCIWLV